ncbi:type II toxin-antitoxin system ribonuclease VapC1 [soil metagenome]
MIVLDASATIDYLLDTSPAADRVDELMHEHRSDLHAPHLMDAEVAQVLRGYAIRGILSEQRVFAALHHLEGLPLKRYPHLPLLGEAMRKRRNLTIYDALYVVLAEALDATLVTKDRAVLEQAGPRAVRV